MQVFGATIKGDFRLAVSLLFIFALGCEEQPGPARRPTNEPVHSGRTLDVAKSPKIADETDALSGKVVSVKDGDTIVVLKDQEQITIRLEGIDCPESGQAFGNKAKQACSELCFGKTVTVKATGKDRYGRTLAQIVLPDGKELHRELVRQGYAWWYRKYSNDERLGQLEADARNDRRGLWADANPVAPWDWRAEKRSKSKISPSATQVVPNGIEIIALLPNPEGRDVGHEQVTIVNSTKSMVYLEGWKLVDKAGNVFVLSGTVSPGGNTVITMIETTMPLNNDGDEVLLIDENEVGRSKVRYSKSQVKSGVVIEFSK